MMTDTVLKNIIISVDKDMPVAGQFNKFTKSAETYIE